MKKELKGICGGTYGHRVCYALQQQAGERGRDTYRYRVRFGENAARGSSGGSQKCRVFVIYGCYADKGGTSRITVTRKSTRSSLARPASVFQQVTRSGIRRGVALGRINKGEGTYLFEKGYWYGAIVWQWYLYLALHSRGIVESVRTVSLKRK